MQLSNNVTVVASFDLMAMSALEAANITSDQHEILFNRSDVLNTAWIPTQTPTPYTAQPTSCEAITHTPLLTASPPKLAMNAQSFHRDN